MWNSVLHHLIDEHEWADGQCMHGPLMLQKNYFDAESTAMCELRKIVMDESWLKTLPFYRLFRHTGILESYHNLRLVYNTKRIQLRYCSVTLFVIKR